MQTSNTENASNDATMRFLTSTHILKQNNLLSFVISLKCPAMTTFSSDNSELQHKVFSYNFRSFILIISDQWSIRGRTISVHVHFGT